jgi:hypothetical protein
MSSTSSAHSCNLQSAPRPFLNVVANFKMAFRQFSAVVIVTVFEEEGNCIVCLEMRADELMRHLISGELTKHRVVRTSPEPLQLMMRLHHRFGKPFTPSSAKYTKIYRHVFAAANHAPQPPALTKENIPPHRYKMPK